jgi:hypothetical protein
MCPISLEDQLFVTLVIMEKKTSHISSIHLMEPQEKRGILPKIVEWTKSIVSSVVQRNC